MLFESLEVQHKPRKRASAEAVAAIQALRSQKPKKAEMLPVLGAEIQQRDIERVDKETAEWQKNRIAKSIAEFGGPENINPLSAQRLFQAVFLRQYKDAICLDLLVTNDEDGDDEIDIQSRAITWFINGSGDFREVCWLAGIEDPEEARLRVLNELEAREVVYCTNKGNWRIDQEELGRSPSVEEFDYDA